MGGEGDVELVPASFWNFENVDPGAQEGERERSWRARVTTYGTVHLLHPPPSP